ncbi:unnamed protein product [Blepharisma stoltei]|uniref:Cyclin N-terminal domain-containing protein n=1 Tax=Blepharisma stoltei TaxID=1481888 RepID=A0AAU9JZH8_9CILI|nr:unnamed protein product [Blepharisma stoltei]
MLADSPYLPTRHPNLDHMKRSRNKRQTDAGFIRKPSSNFNYPRTNSLIEKPNASPVIIPKIIRTVSCYSCASTVTSPPPLDLDSELDPNWVRLAQKYEQKIRVPKNPEDGLYLNKAIDFLTTIETQTSEETLERRPSVESNQDSECTRWVTHSGAIKESFRGCLNFFDWDRFPVVDLSDVPATIPNSLLKDNLNEEFKDKHPFLDQRMTLSKIVNLREDLIFKMCRNMDIEVCTLAIAWTCYVRLLSKNVITKLNRKLYGAICVLIAYKFNEESHLEANRDQIKILIKLAYSMDKHNLLQHKSLSKVEFEVYAHLNFSLLLKYEEFQEEFSYILGRMDTSFNVYMGDFIQDF